MPEALFGRSFGVDWMRVRLPSVAPTCHTSMWLGPPKIDGTERYRYLLSLLNASSDGNPGAPLALALPRNVTVPSGATANRDSPSMPEPIVAGF